MNFQENTKTNRNPQNATLTLVPALLQTGRSTLAPRHSEYSSRSTILNKGLGVGLAIDVSKVKLHFRVNLWPSFWGPKTLAKPVSPRRASPVQIVVRLCMVDGHSIWQFQDDGRESYPKAIHVPANPRGEIADRAFYAAPVLQHVEVAMGIQHVGIAAWQSCQQLQIVRLPPSVTSLEEGTFQGCFVLREVAAPGCVQHSRRVFAECCSLGRVGVSHETEDSNVLAPGAQPGKCAFESCLTLTSMGPGPSAKGGFAEDEGGVPFGEAPP